MDHVIRNSCEYVTVVEAPTDCYIVFFPQRTQQKMIPRCFNNVKMTDRKRKTHSGTLRSLKKVLPV